MSNSEFDQSLIIKPGEEDEFCEWNGNIGLKLCSSAENIRKFSNIPSGVDFRLTVKPDSNCAVIWISKSTNEAIHGKEESPLAFFVNLIIYTIGYGVIGGTIGGLIWFGIVYIIETITTVNWDNQIAFYWGFCISGFLGAVGGFFRKIFNS